MNKKIKIAIVIVFLLILGYGIFYLADYNHAEKTATDMLNGTSNVSVVKTSNGLFLDGSGNDSAVIFYPGGKVEYTSYLPMLINLANRGIDCYLVEMPFNIAFFGQNSADSIMNNSSYDHYFIAGHSLGGVVASAYVNATNNTDGVILLAAYPTEKISKPVLSVYGSNDNALNKVKYEAAKPLIKGNFTEVIIKGGNHAQFAYYGNQSGDGKANITAENQQNQTVDAIINFIKVNS
ncbi:alpha/beta hydrolase [uncultured Methanobrevibacter sp.]|uniref:alpha/beta hydrolase n=1 Tax=uncultured Methanobrevibacter sp. TaxID=253161 RepID=UPI0025CD4D20|nr:alpha/beta hydrolase [uncultured Methanobrevibacter sp.]